MGKNKYITFFLNTVYYASTGNSNKQNTDCNPMLNFNCHLLYFVDCYS